jgi:dTDP-glucose 4,6-dehydratase
MRVLVSGAAGFVGSHLCETLLGRGDTVVGVDNLCTGSRHNLAAFASDPRFQFVEHDICSPLLGTAADAGPFDLVLNFASPASPREYLRLGIETLRVGSVGTENMLELAHKYGARFLHASTSECYGDPLVHPQPESYWGHVNSIGPRSVYDEAKRYAESLVMAYHRYRGVDTALVRIFNTYGTRMQVDDGRVIPNFMAQALRGEDITIYGDGTQTRSFCYVSDEVDGILRLAASGYNLPMNIGNPVEFTMLECAEAVLEVTGSGSRIVHRDLPQDDPRQRKPDITLATQVLGWQPKIALKQGLQLSLGYFREVALGTAHAI